MFAFWAGGLRLARIDPSRRGGMEEPREKSGVLREQVTYLKSPDNLEKVLESPSRQITLVNDIGFTG